MAYLGTYYLQISCKVSDFQPTYPLTSYLSTYLPTYFHTYLLPYLPTYIHVYLPTYIPIYLPTCLPTYLHTYQTTYIPTYYCHCRCHSTLANCWRRKVMSNGVNVLTMQKEEWRVVRNKVLRAGQQCELEPISYYLLFRLE